MVRRPKVKITGSQGSWFAEVRGIGVEGQYPILWKHYLVGTEYKTDWVTTGRQGIEFENKRNKIRDYFRGEIGNTKPVILAEMIAQNSTAERGAPRLKRYIAVFSARVVSIDPEIQLEFIDRIAEPRD